jgi:hypothetical protein
MRTKVLLGSSFVLALGSSACGMHHTGSAPSADRAGGGDEVAGDVTTPSPTRPGRAQTSGNPRCHPQLTSGGSETTTGGSEPLPGWRFAEAGCLCYFAVR